MSLFGNKAGKRLKLQHQEKKTSLHCCVLLCTNSSRYNSILSFHRFPVDEEVKSVWTAKIRREDFSPTDGTRVCSVHFLPGDFVGPRHLKKGAVPCLFAWNKFSIPTPRLNVWQRHPRPPTPELLPADTTEEEDSVQPMEVTVTDHDCCVTPNTSVVVYELTRENEKLREKIEQLQHQLESLQLRSTFGLQRIAGSDEDIRFYTRFASYKSFLAFWKQVEPAANTKFVRISSANAASGIPHRATKLLLVDELLLFLMYLSVGLPLRDLANRFSIHRTTVSRIITSWTHFLYHLLGSIRLWIPPEDVKAHLPPEFAAFPDTQVILDCTEICCQTPSSLLLHSEVYSSYKSHTTFKAMIGIAPHGPITFVSPLYAGSMSDREIFKLSGITKCLTPEMAIMVDKGFLVDNLVAGKVYRPAFLVKNTQMAKEDVQHTQSIARLRVHVERCIRRVNKLFEKVIPLSISGSIDQLFSVACLLVNYQYGPLVKAWATQQ
ncbi:uncharacterized protein LOC116061939 [Sander lucioperca]|nr:uncharacterized protein LOC116061939 [Sander lucioperca]